MTEEEYNTLNGTLALELAAHAAFKNNLAIVEMSLQDQYLLDQISKFRNQIGSIIWFNSNFGGLEIWAACNKVEIVQVEWNQFWERWNTTNVPEEGLMIAWYRVVSEAAAELSGGTAYGIAQSSPDAWIREETFADSAKIREPGELRLVDGQNPSDILRKVIELLESKDIRPPSSKHRPRGVRS
jgi:hypothetical protein